MYRHEDAARPVVLDQRRRLLVVETEPRTDHFRRVVRPALLLGAVEQPLGGQLLGQLELEDDPERTVDLGEEGIQSIRAFLDYGARHGLVPCVEPEFV